MGPYGQFKLSKPLPTKQSESIEILNVKDGETVYQVSYFFKVYALLGIITFGAFLFFSAFC
jgi:hypothetical protein